VLLIDHGRVVLDADAESLRASAVTVSGPGDRVLAFARDHELLHAETLGGHARAVIRTRDAAAASSAASVGLTVEPTPLQQLIVAMSLPRPADGAPLPLDTRSTDLEEAS
jgi:ABC-2 type transport system ATP-binding protein